MTTIARDRNDHLTVRRLGGENFSEAIAHVEELFTRLLIKQVIGSARLVEIAHRATHEIFPLGGGRIALCSTMLGLCEVGARDAGVAATKVRRRLERRDGTATE